MKTLKEALVRSRNRFGISGALPAAATRRACTGLLLLAAVPASLAAIDSEAALPGAASAWDVLGQPLVSLSLLIACIVCSAVLGVCVGFLLGRPVPATAGKHASVEHSNEPPEQSEAQQRLLLIDECPDMLIRYSASGEILDISAASERILGFRPEQMIGRNIFDFLHPDEVFRARKTLSADQLGQHTAINRVRRADGSYVWLETAIRVLPASLGGSKQHELVTVSRDISERDAEQLALREHEALYRRAFEDAAIPTSITDARTGHLLRINNSLCALIGYTRAELRELNSLDVIHPGDWQPLLDLARRFIEGSDYTLELPLRFLRKDGTTIATDGTFTLLRDDRGKPLYFVCQMKPRRTQGD